MSEPTFTFTGQVYPGDTSVIERDGFTLTATIHHDEDQSPPWDNEDGHGPVTDWLRRGAEPGERELSFDMGASRFYNWAEAVEIAKRDGWGVEGGRLEGETADSYATRAAEKDFEFLRGWATDEWTYVGIAVTVARDGVQLTGEYDHAVWGTESLAGEHIAENADGFIDEALAAARAKLASLDPNPALLAAAKAVLAWAADMGGWEAPCWAELRAAVDAASEDAEEFDGMGNRLDGAAP